MDIGLLQLALVAAIVALIVTFYELRASLAPASCSECPHCRALATERAERERELQTWYARERGLDRDDDENRRPR